MLAELSIIPVGGSTHSSAELAKVLKLVEKIRPALSTHTVGDMHRR
jgi:uncharacterized protein YqgV (UPF0045/DUF77 family)